MNDDLKNRGQPDRSLISLKQDHERSYWTNHFGESVETLQSIIDEVGNSVAAVTAALAARRANPKFVKPKFK